MSEARSEVESGYSVLIVDDEPMQLESLKELISLSGYQAEGELDRGQAILALAEDGLGNA